MGNSISATIFFGTSVHNSDDGGFEYQIREKMKKCGLETEEDDYNYWETLLVFNATGKQKSDFVDMSFYDGLECKYLKKEDEIPDHGYSVKQYRWGKYWYNRSKKEYEKNYRENDEWNKFKREIIDEFGIKESICGVADFSSPYFYLKGYETSSEWDNLTEVSPKWLKTTPEMEEKIHDFMEMLGFKENEYMKPAWYITSYYG